MTWVAGQAISRRQCNCYVAMRLAVTARGSALMASTPCQWLTDLVPTLVVFGIIWRSVGRNTKLVPIG